MVKYGYTAYGTITDISGSLAGTIGAHNPFRYKGYYYDRETNMYYCKSRYYVPEWCRWLNADHICFLDVENINGMNLFSYCGNNPITFIDENGNFLSIGFAIAMGVAALFAIAAATVLAKPEINQEVVSLLDDGLNFIEDTIKFKITMGITTLMLAFATLDNVMMSKKKNKHRDPDPFKRPNQKKQYRERKNKARQKETWRNDKFRRDKKPRKHTPGRNHRKFIEAVFLALYSNGLLRF